MTGKDADRQHDGAPSRLWLIAGVAALALGILAFIGLRFLGEATDQEETRQEPVPLVQTVRVEATNGMVPIVEEGFLRPVARVDIVPEVSGKIVSVNPRLTLGGRFEEGEILFTIDQRSFRAELARAEADLASARAALARAQADYARQEELAAIGAVAEARLEQSRAELSSARAAVQQAAAAVEIAEKRLEDTTLTAPFAARVESENVSVGQYVAPGTAVATLYATAAAEISVGIAPQDAGLIRRAWREAGSGLDVRIRPVAGSATSRELSGRIVEIASSLDPEARTVSVLVEVPDAFDPSNEGYVFADDFVEVVLPGMADQPVYTAQAGVVRKESFIWVVDVQGTPEDAQGTLEKVAITPMRRFRDSVAFTASRDLTGLPVVLTALTEEAEGMKVRLDGDATVPARNGAGGSR